MLYFSPFKTGLIILSMVAALLFAMPNFFSKQFVDTWPNWIPKKQLSLGLDLRGGAHLLLEMDVKDLRHNMLQNLREDVRKKLRDAKIGIVGTRLVEKGVQVRIGRTTDMPNALKSLRELGEPVASNLFTGNDTRTLTVEQRGERSVFILLSDAGVLEKITEAMSGAIETVRRRVDAFGTTEPIITRQGAERILVQVPGVQDTQALKNLIGKTAKLSLHEVHPTDGRSSAPLPTSGGYKSYPADDKSDAAGTYYYLKEIPVIRGDQLKGASQGFHHQTNEPVVNFTLNQEGARAFGRFSVANVNRPFAIVLDGKVLSAPNIIEPILGGSAQITGGFTVKSANELAIQLRSGSLPADLTVVEERTVGPSLGRDSIAAGSLAGIVGSVATILLTLWVYGTFGIIAVVGLGLNALFIVALMSVMGSTLTLPGIAGLILTIGMAVDANVLIYERIREELRSGKNAVTAIDAGFSRAMVTIFDSQLTTLVAAIIMFWLGSGPIRGFAVTLSIGIFTTILTAVTIVRFLVSLWLRSEKNRNRQQDVPI
ncbi:MAG: protein translocase subunit SecD [Hyphomicrobiaceae bacterium]|nr:protein translocase subunit SecD [Hyphomicrobiaceae bacterium]